MKFSTEDIIEMYHDGEERVENAAGIDISIIEFQPESDCKGTVIGIPGGPGLPKEHLLPLAMLRNNGYRVVLYDTHNVGKSASHDEPYEMETFRIVLKDLISAYESVILAGHSWGSMLALDLLCMEEEIADGLVAMAPLFDTQDNVQIAEALRADHLSVSDLEYMIECEQKQEYANDEKYERLSDSVNDTFGFIPPIPDFVEQKAYDRFNTDMYEQMWGPEEFVLNDEGVLKYWSVKDELHNISIPTLLITGKKDMFGYHDMYDAAEAIAGSTEVRVLENGSHSFFWEQPGDSIAALRDWLAN